ncbi:MAG: hypothetical protein WDA20_12895 [Desulfuromonadales bacterium]
MKRLRLFGGCWLVSAALVIMGLTMAACGGGGGGGDSVQSLDDLVLEDLNFYPDLLNNTFYLAYTDEVPIEGQLFSIYVFEFDEDGQVRIWWESRAPGSRFGAGRAWGNWQILADGNMQIDLTEDAPMGINSMLVMIREYDDLDPRRPVLQVDLTIFCNMRTYTAVSDWWQRTETPISN